MVLVDVSVKSLKGMVPKPKKAVSIEEMNKPNDFNCNSVEQKYLLEFAKPEFICLLFLQIMSLKYFCRF